MIANELILIYFSESISLIAMISLALFYMYQIIYLSILLLKNTIYSRHILLDIITFYGSTFITGIISLILIFDLIDFVI